ncbi:MAG: hypothetical protein L7F78_20275 [Syntrophales bacterium LBB04]|nr:hypothetical protein [Syntrophales bacterium LBB04]
MTPPWRGEILAVGDDKQLVLAGLLQGQPHDPGVQHRPPVVGNGGRSGLFQLPVVTKEAALQPLGHGRNRVYPRQAGLRRLRQDVFSDGGAVVDRPGVGHAAHRAETAADSRPAAGRDSLLVLESRFAQVHVQVDQARNHDFSGSVNHLDPGTGIY